MKRQEHSSTKVRLLEELPTEIKRGVMVRQDDVDVGETDNLLLALASCAGSAAKMPYSAIRSLTLQCLSYRLLAAIHLGQGNIAYLSCSLSLRESSF